MLFRTWSAYARPAAHRDGKVAAIKTGMKKKTGISNRMTAEEEARDRRANPPVNTGAPLAEDASGRKGDPTHEDTDGDQTAHKAGSRSVAQKEAGSKYADRSMPPSRKVPGAFGEEPE
jgi:hypothetical protein